MLSPSVAATLPRRCGSSVATTLLRTPARCQPPTAASGLNQAERADATMSPEQRKVADVCPGLHTASEFVGYTKADECCRSGARIDSAPIGR